MIICVTYLRMDNNARETLSLLTFTPLIQTTDHNLIRISRTNTIENPHFIAGGLHKGIIINRLTTNYTPLENFLPWGFSVWLDDGQNLRQEIRSFQFAFYESKSSSLSGDHSEVAHQFIKHLFASFPKDYASFFKLILRLMQTGFGELKTIDVDMKFAAQDEAIPQPDAKEYEDDVEIENVTIGHVQDVLEHAFPNSLSVEMIADSLRCSEDEVTVFLSELERMGVAAKVQNEWIRVDNFSIPESNYVMQNKHHPTVAIITCLFVEKQSIDAIIRDSSTLHKYSKAGDSNVYTIGNVGGHRVVATKLAMIGDSREAITSAGSITTRLLGSFQHIDHVIIVGVGGGVPHFTDPAQHTRLGDVVISYRSSGTTEWDSSSTYVYAHSFVVNRKTEQVDGFATHNWQPKSNQLADVLRNGGQTLENEWRRNATELINTLNETAKGNEYDFSRPPNDSDVLTVQIGQNNVVVFPHPNAERVTPMLHFGPIGAMATLRRPPAACASQPPVVPPRRDRKVPNENVPPSTPEDSNNSNGKDAAVWVNANHQQQRDRFAEENKLRAFDAGFDSVIAAVTGSRIDSWMLVRGIADYQQGSSRLGKMWQPYASANAAAVVSTVLNHIPAS